MVRHKPSTKIASNNDLAKLKFKPGKFVIVKTTKATTIPKISSIAMAIEHNYEPTTSASTSSTGIKSALEINVPVSNKFQVLENQEQMETASNNSTTSQLGGDKVKTVKPPPIIIHHKILKHTEFIEGLGKEVKKGFHIKNTKNITNVFINDIEEYRKYLSVLEKDEVNFHTYSEKENKTHAFLLKGLDSNPTLEEIKCEIEERYNVKIVNIHNLKNTSRDMYLVITDNTIYLRFLVGNVKYVCHTKIQWERYTSRTPVLQCRRCQRWGHATTNCKAKPVCTKCGEDHWTRECKNVNKDNKETHQNIKCANCKGKHLAFSKDCPVYQNRVEQMEQRKILTKRPSQKKPTFVPAPMPLNSPWISNNMNRGRITGTNGTPSMFNVSSVIPNRVTNENEHNKNDSQSNFSSLINELNVLNQLIDLEKMVRLVRELNIQLRDCTTDQEKIFKFNQFCQTHFKTNEISANPCLP